MKKIFFAYLIISISALLSVYIIYINSLPKDRSSDFLIHSYTKDVAVEDEYKSINSGSTYESFRLGNGNITIYEEPKSLFISSFDIIINDDYKLLVKRNQYLNSGDNIAFCSKDNTYYKVDRNCRISKIIESSDETIVRCDDLNNIHCNIYLDIQDSSDLSNISFLYMDKQEIKSLTVDKVSYDAKHNAYMFSLKGFIIEEKILNGYLIKIFAQLTVEDNLCVIPTDYLFSDDNGLYVKCYYSIDGEKKYKKYYIENYEALSYGVLVDNTLKNRILINYKG